MGALAGDQIACYMRCLFVTHDKVPPKSAHKAHKIHPAAAGPIPIIIPDVVLHKGKMKKATFQGECDFFRRRKISNNVIARSSATWQSVLLCRISHEDADCHTILRDGLQ
jgi:hypothetical protein